MAILFFIFTQVMFNRAESPKLLTQTEKHIKHETWSQSPNEDLMAGQILPTTPCPGLWRHVSAT